MHKKFSLVSRGPMYYDPNRQVGIVQWNKRPLIVIGILISIHCSLFSQDFVRLEDHLESFRPKGKIYLLEDPESRFTIDDIRGRFSDFTLDPSAEPNLGFTQSTYWAMFLLQNNSTYDDWLLELAYAPFDYLDLFVLDGTEENAPVLLRGKAGDLVPIADKTMPNRTLTSSLGIAPGDTVRVLLKLRTESSFVLSLWIWREGAFKSRNTKTILLFGVLFGFYLIMTLYHIPLYFSSKERSYLFYSLFVAVYLLFQTAISGIAGIYLWPNQIWWISKSLAILGTLSILFTVIFTQEFLQTKKYTPGLHRIYTGLTIVSGAFTVAAFFIPYFIAIQITNYTMSVIGILYIVTAVKTYKKGFTPARYYLIAWISFIAAVLLTAFKNFGVLPSSRFTNNVLYLGGALEIVLLSFALGDKIRLLTKERETAEQEKIKLKEDMVQALQEQLYTDNLTGLAGRNKLLADLSNLEPTALFIINIDQFKGINNFYGNVIGDRLIKMLGERLQNLQAPGNPRLYRLHADEFALILDEPIDPGAINSLAFEIHAKCQQEPFVFDGFTVPLEVSIGIASEGKNILEKADIALTHSKQYQINYCLYNSAMKTLKQYENNLRWIELIRAAVSKDGVFPVFQPILENNTGRIDKYETLIRIRLEDGSIASPGQFLPIAKKAKLYPDLSKIVIDKSLRILSERDATFSLNLSIDDMQNEETMDFVRDCIEKYKVQGKIVFEILESEGIENYEDVGSCIEMLKFFDAKFAIDDFGSGYSNFEHLLRLDIDFLKIDASLIKEIHIDPHARMVVETIIEFAAKLGYQTIAEYVHNEEVFNTVKELKIDFSQGYHISEPRELL